MEIKFIISDENAARISKAMNGLFPRPRDEEGNPLFTESEWAKERIRRWIIATVKRWEIFEAQKAATEEINIPDDLIV